MFGKLSPKQEKILDYYNSYYNNYNNPPTYRQAAEELNISPSAIFKHVKNLEKMGYFTSGEWGRSVRVVSGIIHVPLVGNVACGDPIDIHEEIKDFIEISKPLAGDSGNLYALRAIGDSMINAGISNRDILIIRKQEDLEDGSIGVVAIGDDPYSEKATLKRIYHKPESLVLKPSNDQFPTTVVHNGQIRGKLVSVIRQY